ncbi:MAG: hypothetical protein AB7O56_02340 [Bauldia sp.]
MTTSQFHRLSRAFAGLALGLAAGIASPALAQVEAPAQGTPLRAEILDALRGHAVSELGAPIEFVVNDIRVLGEWAYVDATPQRPGGGEIFYVYTRYQGAQDAGAFDDNAVALLRQTPAGWLVYEYSFGATDVAWLPWMTWYPVPPEVFPGPGTGGPAK